ncbi:MAG: hypothetical protein FWJ66_10620 [Caldibacillus sp.]
MYEKKSKVKIAGFRMHQHLLEQIRFVNEGSERFTASAYAVYLSMLYQLHIEKNARGILKEFNLAEWARKLNIPYSTMYDGFKFLERKKFFEERIQNGMPVLVLRDIEDLNNPKRFRFKRIGQKKGTPVMNYLIVPFALFKTTVFADLVHHSCPEGFELILSLLNQFRTHMSKKNKVDIKQLKQDRLMSTLKKKLGKSSAKSVRAVLDMLRPIFDIEFEGVQIRGNQIHIEKVWFQMRPECVQEENVEDFNIKQLTALLSHELNYFLDGHKIKYKPKDQISIIFAFKQEVYNRLKFIDGENGFDLIPKLREYFLVCMDDVAEYLQTKKKEIHNLGAFFRKVFRNNLPKIVNEIPYGVRFDAKVNYFRETGEFPEFLKFEY